MSKRLAILCAVLALSCAAPGETTVVAGAAAKPVTWEYLVDSDAEPDHLRALGADRWELVAVAPYGYRNDDPAARHYYKRPAGKGGAK